MTDLKSLRERVAGQRVGLQIQLRDVRDRIRACRDAGGVSLDRSMALSRLQAKERELMQRLDALSQSEPQGE